MELSKNIQYVVLDVDGTMTDGSIYYDENGNELKKFNTRDAAGFFVAKEMGIKTIVVTGRECHATLRRMKEMKVDYIFQDVKNKAEFLADYFQKNGIEKKNVGYIGDDLNDYNAMQLCGFKACPFDATEEIKQLSDYVSVSKGGYGVVRDVVRYIASDQWENLIKRVYKF